VYVEIAGSHPNVHGLLMNARFIQGIFDDKAGRERYHCFGRRFDPDTNTNELIAALPEWYRYGLRAFTVGFGGGPCFTVPNSQVDNNPFGADGLRLDPKYAERMDQFFAYRWRKGSGLNCRRSRRKTASICKGLSRRWRWTDGDGFD
jgi:hypothetical protein